MSNGLIVKADGIAMEVILEKAQWVSYLTRVIEMARKLMEVLLTQDSKDQARDDSVFALVIVVQDSGRWEIGLTIDDRAKVQAGGRSFEHAAWLWLERAKPTWWVRDYCDTVDIFESFDRPLSNPAGPYESKKAALGAAYKKALKRTLPTI